MAEKLTDQTYRINKWRGRCRLALGRIGEALKADAGDIEEVQLHTDEAVKLLGEGLTLLKGGKGAGVSG